MIFEGDIFLFTTGFLLSRGFLDAEPAFLVLFLGAIVGDSLWYFLGYKINHSPSRFGQWLIRATAKFDDQIISSPFRTIFVSKYIYGAHHFILARAGVLKLKYRELIKDDFFASLIWVFLVGGLGFLSGASFDLVKKYLKFAEYALILGLVIFLLLDFIIVKYSLKKKIND